MALNIYNSKTKKWESVASLRATDLIVNNPKFKSTTVDGCLVELDDKIQSLMQNIAWIYNNGTVGGGGGGGGGGASTGKIVSETFLANNGKLFASTKENIRIHYKVTSKSVTNFELTLKCGDFTKNQSVRPNTDYYWDIGTLKTGNYSVFISGFDVDQMPLDYFTAQIVIGALEVISDFDDSSNIFNVASTISIPYTVNSYLENKIRVYYNVNGSDDVIIEDVPKGVLQRLVLGQKPVGNYTVKLWATTQGEGGASDMLTSNTLNWDIKVAGTQDIFVTIPSNIAKIYNQGIPINLPYSIINNTYSTYLLTLLITDANGTVIRNENYSNISSGNNTLTISTDSLASGKYKIKLSAKVQDDQSIVSKNDPVIDIEIKTDADFTPWQIIKSELIGHFTGRGKNKNEMLQWKNEIPIQPGEKELVFSLFGMNGSSNGFVEGKNALIIGGESYGKLNFDIFRDDRYALNGTTINILYKFKNNGNSESRILDVGKYDNSKNLIEGAYICAGLSQVKTSENSVSTVTGEDYYINQTFVIGNSDIASRFLKIYNDGVLTACKPITGSDSLVYDGNMFFGCRRTSGVNSQNQEIDILDLFAECEIKDIKVYRRALTDVEVVYNYVCDDYYLHTLINSEGIEEIDKARQLALRSINSFDSSGNFQVDTTNNSPFPILEIDFGNDDTTRKEFIKWIDTIVWNVSEEEKFKQFPCIIKYNDYKNKISVEKSGGGTYICLQGTSSTGYTRKNFDIGFGVNPTTGKEFLFSPRTNWLPENIYTLKCNMMDSSHSNNIGTGLFLNGSCIDKDYNEVTFAKSGYWMGKYPPMLDSANNINYDKIKYSIDGFPIILLCDLGGGSGGNKQMTYMGIYTFNLGRTSYYNLGLKNYTYTLEDNNKNIVKEHTDIFTGLYSKDTTFAYEVSTSSNDGAGAFKQISEKWIQNDWKKRFPKEDSLQGDTALRKVLLTTGRSEGVTEYQKDLSGNIEKDAQGQPIIAYTAGTNWKDINVWNKSSLVDYLIVVYLLGMTDNMGKNFVIKTWNRNGEGDNIWYATFYDMDTILGVDNVGSLTYGPSVDIDAYPNGNFADAKTSEGKGKGSYNLSDSRLWNMVREYNYAMAGSVPPVTAEYLVTRYAYYRNNGVINGNNVFNHFKYVIDQIGANYYNKDTEIKYLTKFVNADGDSGYHNITFLNGTREVYTKNWIKKRIQYLDSVFDYGNISISDSNLSKPIKFRFNVSGSPSKTRIIDMKSRSPIFVKVLWSGEDVPDDNQKLLVDSTKFTKFQKGFNANFQSTDFTFGPEIMFMNNLNEGAPSVLRLEYCTNLMELDLSGNTLLKLISLSGCRSLRNLNLRNCTKLGQALTPDEAASEGTTQSNVDLSNCTNLQNVDIAFTGLTQIKLPDGGTLKNLICNDSGLQKISLKNQSFLTKVDFTNCYSLETVDLDNCANLEEIILTNASLSNFSAKNCPNLKKVILTKNIKLKSVSFASCPNVTYLDLTDCSHQSLGFYSGNESSDLGTALNLIGCPNLEELILTRCSAQVIYFNGDCRSLKRLVADSSLLKQTIIGAKSDGSSIITYSKFNNQPALDFKQFDKLSYVFFNNATNVWNIINLTITATNESKKFQSCTNLRRITGNITVIGTMNTWFQGLSTNFKLNDYTGKNPASTSTQFDLTLNMNSVSTVNDCFNNNQGVQLNDMIYFLKRLPNCTEFVSTYFNCQGIVTNNSTPIPEDLFSGCSNARNFSHFWYLCYKISGPLPIRIFANTTKAYYFYRFANGCKFNGFYSNTPNTDPSILFQPMPSLSTISEMFPNNGLVGTFLAKPLFMNNPGLSSAYAVFSGNSGLELNLGRTALGERHDDLFANNPNIANIDSIFANCKVTGNIHENLFGGVEATRNDNGVTRRYPGPALTSALGSFANTGIGGTLDERIFQRLTNVIALAPFYSNRNVSGTIPPNLFKYNTKLINLNNFFNGTDVSGTIPETLLKYNTKLQSLTSLFSNCNNLGGSIPEGFFEGLISIVNINNLFYGCTNLIGSIPNNLFKIKNPDGTYPILAITEAKQVFYNCCRLSGEIPPDLFILFSNVKDLTGFFQECGTIDKGIVTKSISGFIPENLIQSCPKLEIIDYMFSRMNYLEPFEFEVEENGSIVKKYQLVSDNFFKECKNITSMKSTFDCFGISSTRGVSKLTPAMFQPLTKLLYLDSCFYNAKLNGLTLDSNLFNKCNVLESISGMFSNWSASGDSSWGYILPQGLFTQYNPNTGNGQRLKNIENAFYKCSGLTGEPIKFWDGTFTTLTNLANCYGYCRALNGYSNGGIPPNYGGGK